MIDEGIKALFPNLTDEEIVLTVYNPCENCDNDCERCVVNALWNKVKEDN